MRDTSWEGHVSRKAQSYSWMCATLRSTNQFGTMNISSPFLVLEIFDSKGWVIIVDAVYPTCRPSLVLRCTTMIYI